MMRQFTLSFLLVTLAGCVRPASAPIPELVVSVRVGAIAGPDSVQAGWTRLRVEEDGGDHILVVFQLPETAGDSVVDAFLTAVDTARQTPAPALALGGPEVGDTGEVVLQLKPGRYILGCVSRGADGHRHARTGEARLMRVVGTDTTAAPSHTMEVGLTDFAFTGPDHWKAGPQLLRIENQGRQDHHLRLARLNPGAQMASWLVNPDDFGETVAGVSRLGPGAVAELPVLLERATYVLYCLVADVASGRPHAVMGMLRAVVVE